MVSLEEAKEIQEAGQYAVFLEELTEITEGGNSPGGIIGETLEVVERHFYLVPKREVAVDDQLVLEPAPEGVLEGSVFEMWANVSN